MSDKNNLQIHKHLEEMLKEFELAFYLTSPELTFNQKQSLKNLFLSIIG
ncbi:MAG: hypothetical protein AAGF07_05295 [Patescibacteria group bacterium]